MLRLSREGSKENIMLKENVVCLVDLEKAFNNDGVVDENENTRNFGYISDASV